MHVRSHEVHGRGWTLAVKWKRAAWGGGMTSLPFPTTSTKENEAEPNDQTSSSKHNDIK